MQQENERFVMYGKMHVALERIEACRAFAGLIPEVRTNMAYALPRPRSTADVLAVEGRITVVGGMPHASGRLRFGGSSHMARLLSEVGKREPSLRAGINFASNAAFAQWLSAWCADKQRRFSKIDRSGEPEEIRRQEGASMPWKVGEAIRTAGGEVPRVFYETGVAGKEDVTVLLGKDPIEVADEVCRIAEAWAANKMPAPAVGKIDLDTFKAFVMKRLGKKDGSVLVPPLTGVDAAVLDIGSNRVLVLAEDPIFCVPGQPLEMFGWYTVHIGASDVAVMGVKPRYMSYTLLMPPGTPDEDFRCIVDSIHRAALELDIAIVGGHTGFYPGFAAPTIGGVTVFATARRDGYVTPAGATPDDHVILTKGPAIEAAGILASLRQDDLLRNHPASLVEKAKNVRMNMTVVKDAVVAMEAGGVSGMHDATEGGVIGGLYEMAHASGVGMEIDESRFIYPDEVRIVCETLSIDPVKAIAEGSLLITARSDRSENIVGKLKENGIPSSVIGRVVDDTSRRTIKRVGGEVVPLAIPPQDPFWPVFFESVPSS